MELDVKAMGAKMQDLQKKLDEVKKSDADPEELLKDLMNMFQ